MKILVAVDGSAFTKRMLAYLAAHDEWLGPQHDYTVLHAVPRVPPRAAAVIDKAVLKGYYAEEAEKVFKPVRSFLAKQAIPATFVSRIGAPADILIQAAQPGAFDLILMGSHGHGSLGKLLLGSVTNKVIAQTKIPVLLIR